MFILSVGMPKSGSTLFSFYQREILMKYVDGNGQLTLEQLVEKGYIEGLGHFVFDLGKPGKLEQLYELSLKEGPFVVKTHAPITESVRKVLDQKRVIVTFIHRDPRDIILSAIDHGKRPMKNPQAGSFFRQFTDVEKSIPLVKEICMTAANWLTYPEVGVYSYFDLLNDPETSMKRFANVLGIVPENDFLEGVILNYTIGQEKGKRQFNTGKLLRFRDEMTSEEIELCNHHLMNEISQYGYMIDQ